MDDRAEIETCQWMVREALAGASEIDILAGLCGRLSDAGLALVRASVASDLLDPTFDARGVRWLRTSGAFEESFARVSDDSANTNWTQSPFFALVEGRKQVLRRRLDASYRRGEFAMLDRFQDEGVTDYIAFAVLVGEGLRLGEGEGIVASWTTDARGGFTDAHVELFTRIADTASADSVLALLNDYAEAQVEAIESHGGHVLKFIGDGMLAIFPHDDTRLACRHALDAAAEHRDRIAELNQRRSAAGLPVTDTHVALHLGELLYGNLGSPRRLDFTVLGPAVNEAARIEALCASLERNIIVSSAFAEAAGDARSLLVSLGRYAMKGVARPQELFTLEPD